MGMDGITIMNDKLDDLQKEMKEIKRMNVNVIPYNYEICQGGHLTMECHLMQNVLMELIYYM